jgi:hypothetical protein
VVGFRTWAFVGTAFCFIPSFLKSRLDCTHFIHSTVGNNIVNPKIVHQAIQLLSQYLLLQSQALQLQPLKERQPLHWL